MQSALPANTIVQGDCVAGLAGLPAGCVDLAFADPPFNIGYEYDVYDDAQERGEYLAWSRQWITGVHRALKPTGALWLAIGDEYAAELKLLAQDIGFCTRSWVIWYYTFGVNCKRKFSRSHAHLFHLVKNPSEFTFLSDEPENRIPSARQLVYGDSRANPQGRLPDDTWILRPQDLAECFTPAEDTWYFPRVAGTFKERAGFHGCQMPEQLLGRILRLCSAPGELVLDPFSGSATTLVVAKKLGRRFLGFELSEDYAARGRARLNAVRAGDALEGAAEPTVSAPATPASPTRGKRNPSAHSAQAGAAATALPALAAAAGAPAESSALERELIAGLVDALRHASDGYSVDRVVADPELNARLIARCEQLGLVGDARTWNRTLFRLRKAGALASVPTTKRTEISWLDSDPYRFGSEIALRHLQDQGHKSLDEILCDPQLAAEFDLVAKRFAPGFTPLEYRWAALKLRKEAKVARARGKLLVPGRFTPAVPAGERSRAVPEAAGVYVVQEQGSRRALYAGECLNLRDRLARQFEHASGDGRALYGAAGGLEVRYFLAEARPVELTGYQSRLVAKLRPCLNCLELAAGA